MNFPKPSKPKILIVDDEPDNLDLLYRTFYRDYQVLKAESGPEALDILAHAGEVAVIISDQRMPKMSGTEFLSLTAAQYPDVIRIILTGYTDVDDLVDAINAGQVFKYVTKPWNAEELQAVVQQAVDTHNVLRARTEELQRALKQESLLYAVTNTIRSAPNYRQMLQRIVESVGQVFEVNLAICRPCQDEVMLNEWFVYHRVGECESSPAPELLAQTVWQTLDVQIIQDCQADERFQADQPQSLPLAVRNAYEQTQIRSSLLVPLFYRLELMAVLALHQCHQPRFWQNHEVQLVVTVADQAALALSQARSYEQATALAQRQSLVNTITTTIRSSLDPQNIFAAITQQLGQALQVDGCALSLWTEDDEYVQCVGLYDAMLQEVTVAQEESGKTGQETNLVQTSLPQSMVPIVTNPVLLHLIETKQPVVLDDLTQHPDFNQIDQPLRSQARALLVVPLMAEGKIIGSISLRHNTQIRHWQPADVELAQVVASQASVAVQQARLYQTTRQQAERLLEADRMKNELFQNISHEFRTPLTLMIGPLEAAIHQQQDLPLDQVKIALRNARRLLRLVNQLLDLQRFDAGQMQPSFRPCDLVAFCRNTVEAFAVYCEKKGIQLQTEFSEECPFVYLDIERFDKVLYNLLSNAMKFTPAGGTILVKVEPVGDHCLLQVKDTGIGIRNEQIPHLFERFRQAEGSVSRSHEGSGLGLALVKELVELHGGQITVESIYGQGTTFNVWLHLGCYHLPLTQVLEVPAELQLNRAAVELADVEIDVVNDMQLETDMPLVEVPRNHQRYLLVVDDNPDLRKYVSRILRQSFFEYDILFARNGAEGFEVTQKYRPDLIVTDLMMPLVSGLDFIKMVRENEELKGTPVILLTAKADEDNRIEGAERGADAYLSKPFNDRELLAEVRNLLALKETERRIVQLNNYLTESVLRRFLPPSMVKAAAQGQLSLDLRPEPRLITVLFSDIVGFTQLANTLRSRRVSEVLNEYLAKMTKAVFDNGGTVDKFVGDAIMALFGAPEELTPNEQVKRAIATARQMLASLDALNQKWQEDGIIGNGVEPVRFRCGIHQGTAVVGMFGGEERSDYTAVGPSVNIAARLQEASEPNCILVSAVVADYIDEDEIVKYKSLKLKGIDETVLTFMVNRERGL